MLKKLNGYVLTIVLALTAALLSSCTNSDRELQEVDPAIEATLKVMYYDEKQFYEMYGNFFSTKFPNVQLEVISTQPLFYLPSEQRDAAFYQLIEDKNPDIILVDEDRLNDVVNKEYLYKLDSVIKQDNFDLNNILPLVAERTKELGNGSYYALSSRFSSYAIYYNIDLFNKYNIDLPRNRMTWDELLTLTQRFPTEGTEDERIYGFAFSKAMSEPIGSLILEMGAAEGLQYLDSSATKVTMDITEWRRIIEHALQTYKTGAINTSTLQGPNDLFVNNRIAMQYEGSFYVSQIKAAQSQGMQPLNWGIVTVPVDPNYPNASSSFFLADLFGIYNDSSNKSLAWEFIKFVNSEQAANALSKTINGTLSVRPAYAPDNNGIKLDAFYQLSELRHTSLRYEKLPPAFNMESIIQNVITEAIANEYTLDEVIRSIQEEGNETLKIMLEHQNSEKKEQN